MSGIRRLGIPIILTLCMTGCCVAPLRVADPLEVTVVDAETDKPIPAAQVIYLACDVHAAACKDGRLIRTVADEHGRVKIPAKRTWGFWIAAPGGLPAPDHVIAVWAQGYSAFLFNQYASSLESRMKWIQREDILGALSEIPSDRASTDPRLNSVREFIGGRIKLVKSKVQ